MYKVKGKPWAYSGAIDVSDCATAKTRRLRNPGRLFILCLFF